MASLVVGTLFLNVSGEEDVVPVLKEGNIAKAFQTGTYSDFEEASREAGLKKGIVVADNDNYHVYVSILNNDNNIEKMANYLDDLHVYYYIKTIDIPDNFKDTLNKYEDLMKTSTSIVAFNQLNKKILEGYNNAHES